MISRRDVLRVFLSLSTLSWGKKMEDTVIKGCVIKKKIGSTEWTRRG